MKFGPRAVEYPFVEVKQMNTDSIERLHSQAASEAFAGDDLFTKVKGLITDLITDNRLLSQSSSEANHRPYHDDELVNAGKKKADLEKSAGDGLFAIQRLRR